MSVYSQKVKFNFCSFKSLDKGGEKIRDCASLYCRIWQEPPWNEFFWTPEQVLSDLEEQGQRPGAEGFLVLRSRGIKKEVVGFSWGYQVSSEELAQLSANPEFEKILSSSDFYFYIDELGIDPCFRKKGLGRKLTQLLLARALEQGAEAIFLRTEEKARAARRLYASLGFREMFLFDQVHKQRSYWCLTFWKN